MYQTTDQTQTTALWTHKQALQSFIRNLGSNHPRDKFSESSRIYDVAVHNKHTSDNTTASL